MLQNATNLVSVLTLLVDRETPRGDHLARGHNEARTALSALSRALAATSQKLLL